MLKNSILLILAMLFLCSCNSPRNNDSYIFEKMMQTENYDNEFKITNLKLVKENETIFIANLPSFDEYAQEQITNMLKTVSLVTLAPFLYNPSAMEIDASIDEVFVQFFKGDEILCEYTYSVSYSYRNEKQCSSPFQLTITGLEDVVDIPFNYTSAIETKSCGIINIKMQIKGWNRNLKER